MNITRQKCISLLRNTFLSFVFILFSVLTDCCCSPGVALFFHYVLLIRFQRVRDNPYVQEFTSHKTSPFLLLRFIAPSRSCQSLIYWFFPPGMPSFTVTFALCLFCAAFRVVTLHSWIHSFCFYIIYQFILILTCIYRNIRSYLHRRNHSCSVMFMLHW